MTRYNFTLAIHHMRLCLFRSKATEASWSHVGKINRTVDWIYRSDHCWGIASTEVNIIFLGIVTLLPIATPVVSNGPHLTVCVHLTHALQSEVQSLR